MTNNKLDNLIPIQNNSMPVDNIAEKALLGCILLNNDIIAEISNKIKVDSFFNIRNQLIYNAMIEIYQDGNAIDEITVGDKLRQSKKLDEAGGYVYISELSNVAPINVNATQYADIISKHYFMRKITETTREISRRSADPTENLEDILSELEDKISTIHGISNQVKLSPISDVLVNVIELLEERSKNLTGLIGLETGFIELDDITMGLQPSDLVVLAARPSMGKTSFALNIASHVALQRQETVYFFSLEMSKEQIAMRIIGSEAEIDSHNLKKGTLSNEQWQKVFKVSEKINNSSFFISDVAGMSFIDMISLARAKASRHPPKLIVVDYLQLIRSGNKSINREQEIADISRSLKALAKTLNVPIIAVSQLNRGPENRANKRPNMADIRESGAIEQDADLILFLYRDEVYNPNSLDAGQAEIIIAKHRNGQIGTKKLAFLGKYTKFGNLAIFPPEEPYETI